MNQQILNSVNTVINPDNKVLTACSVTISSTKVSYETLLDTITNFKAQQGWIACQSSNISFTMAEKASNCIKALKTGGVCSINKLLSAELSKKIDKTTQSMTIRHLYDEYWQITTFKELQELKEETEHSKNYLCDTINHHATSDLGKLSHQRLWKETEDDGFEARASYFTGFIEGKENTNPKEGNNHAN